ncbi:MAG: hypothetical protein JNL82_18350 [Myxococcales bacterium]|nr:hypothetical protein [Myxococcales bacterium]
MTPAARQGRDRRAAWCLLGVLLAACRHGGPNPRTLHYVGDTLVATSPPDHRAYTAYLQAQLALASEPPDLARALEQISLAIEYDGDDAHLWTVRGEVELRRGDVEAARRSSQQALALRPGYPPAERLAARLHGGGHVVDLPPPSAGPVAH